LSLVTFGCAHDAGADFGTYRPCPCRSRMCVLPASFVRFPGAVAGLEFDRFIIFIFLFFLTWLLLVVVTFAVALAVVEGAVEELVAVTELEVPSVMDGCSGSSSEYSDGCTVNNSRLALYFLLI
jgi:hypothetical protein